MIRTRGTILALWLSAFATTSSLTEAQCAGGPTTCGQWTSHGSLGVACTDTSISCGRFDEIGHAALIPSGLHKGRVLFWTRCDPQPHRGSCGLYASHILDPLTMSVVDSPSFSPALPGTPPATEGDGHFCAGHAWMLDQNGDPKLIAAGGTNYLNSGKASVEVSWFDPSTNGWLDGPSELPDPNSNNNPPRGSWYPTVVTFLDTVLNQYRPIALGGTDAQGGGAKYTGWWKMSLSSLTWSINPGSTYEWHWYPRSLYTTPARVVTAGYEQVDTDDPENPCHEINTSVDPQTHVLGPDPNVTEPAVDRWHFNNVALLHTLESGWTWNSIDPMSQYDLDRIVGTMGTKNNNVNDTNNTGLPYTLEKVGTSWISKATASRGRVYSNATILPDGSILIAGSQNHLKPEGFSDTTYYPQADRFDPGSPTSQGAWAELASVPQPFPPRGYHNVSMLLPDGSVLMMGGQKQVASPLVPADSVDRFEPPYLFQEGRPVLKNVPGTIHYGETFSVCARPLQPQNPIVRFCLIGIGSVTHHHNCCQRYIELMWRVQGSGCAQFDVNIELIAPTKEMAPARHYMLFAVDSRGVPSLGKFVKVTF